MPKKTAKVPSEMVAMVKFTYGKGRKAGYCIVKAPVVFENIYQSTFNPQTDAADVEDEAISAAGDLDRTEKVLNKKELTAAFKRWKKERE